MLDCRAICYYFFLIIFPLAMTGCSSVKRTPLPPQLINEAQVVGLPNVRDWGYKQSPIFQKDLVKSMCQRRKYQPSLYEGGSDAVVNVLAISGGGTKGAFGAGVLNGWSHAGTRPQFTVVTGISTGAMIAPFAFLGSEYDSLIAKVYSNVTVDQFAKKKPILLSILTSDSLASSEPLAKLISKHVTMDLLLKIADAYDHGRRLYIGTTNLDARELVIWNMTAIASYRNQRSLDLFRKVMLASASIPVAFPPAFIRVQANGKIYDEMHVDGGVTTEVFFYEQVFNIQKAFEKAGASHKPKIQLYILRNNQIHPPYAMVKPKVLPIGKRALASLTTNQGVGDLYRIFMVSKHLGIDFNLAYIPESYRTIGENESSRAESKRMYDLGYNLAENNYPWEKYPPGYDLILKDRLHP